MPYIEDTQIKNGPTSRVRCWTMASDGWKAHLVSSRPRENFRCRRGQGGLQGRQRNVPQCHR